LGGFPQDAFRVIFKRISRWVFTMQRILGVVGATYRAFRLANCNNGLNGGLFARTFNNVATNAWWNYGASFLSYTWNSDSNATNNPTPLTVEIPVYPP